MEPGDEARFGKAWQLRGADAAASLKEGLSLADDLEAAGATDHDLGRCKLLEASSRWRLSQYTEALGCLLRALELLDPEDASSRAAALLDLATVRTYFGLHDEALELLLEALAIFEELDDLAGRGSVYNNLGIVFWNRGDYDEARRAYTDSLEVRQSLEDRDGAAACHNNLGKVFTETGDYDRALEELQSALDGWEQVDNPRGIGVALNNIGLIHHRLEEPDLALEHYERSLEVKARVGDRQGASETRTHLGRILTELGRTDEARPLLERAVADAEELGIIAEQADAYAALSELYKTVGDHEAALVWFHAFHYADRKVFNQRSTERMQALQVAFRLDRAEREGATDGLTGLANRRALDRILHSEFARSRTESRPLSLVLMDLDEFKSVNDDLGHATGDEVLRAVASVLRDHTRKTDLPARYGGEEFAVVLPDTSLPEAVTAAHQLCDLIRGYPWWSVHEELAVTISIGVASAEDAADVDALLAMADRHLYRAKHSGKDRVEA